MNSSSYKMQSDYCKSSIDDISGGGSAAGPEKHNAGKRK